MEDKRIVELYWQRSEQALRETEFKYGRYCYSIAYNILSVEQDAEECVNDTYLDAWRSMPPHRPPQLSAFLGKITRRIAVDRLRYRLAEKRGGGEVPLILDELEECLSLSEHPQKELERSALISLLNDFLRSLSDTERRVFVCRYWYAESIAAISQQLGWRESKVKSMLHRSRGKLRKRLEKEELI